MPALNWVAFDTGVTWDQANALAVSVGARLLINDHDPSMGANWPSDLADAIGDATRYEFPAWFGITALPAGGYQWVNGAPVDPAWAATRWFGGVDPNADADPANDTLHPVFVGNRWASLADLSETEVRFAFIEYTDTKSVHGSSYRDTIIGGGGPGETVRTFGGDDRYFGQGGGKIYLGEGDDLAVRGQFEFPNEWVSDSGRFDSGLIFDGPGEDIIIDAWAVHAAIDGDDDDFMAHRVSYTDDVAGVTITPVDFYPELFRYQAEGANGVDRLLAVEVVGGSGGDHFEGVPRMQGRSGGDYLAPGVNELSASPYAEGGEGDDTLVASTDERTELRGGDGNDLLLLRGPAEVSGGAGMDRFVFEADDPVTIVDLTSQDRIDLSALTDVAPADLFEDGYLELAYAQGYTLVSFDADGGGDEAELLITLKGSFSQGVLEGLLIA